MTYFGNFRNTYSTVLHYKCDETTKQYLFERILMQRMTNK